jgi:predicted phage-related endonuclease
MQFGLTSERLKARKDGLGASDARVIMSGDEEAIIHLWKLKRGEVEPDDFSDNLPAVMGLWTEELNRIWYERQTGRAVTDAGKSVSGFDYLITDLDGLTTTERGEPAVFEAKHLNPFSYKTEDAIERYQPQLQHKMMLTGRRFTEFSVFVGTMKWEVSTVAGDSFYQSVMLERLVEFWEAVQSGKPPCAMPAVEAPKAPAFLRTVDMTGDNAWADSAFMWKMNKDAARNFEKAAKALKAKVDKDVGEATGHGIVVKRDKAGSLRISEE